jgi:predicted ATPase
MIRRFTIKGFKRFEQETVIDLDGVTVLIGANNSGKSTILHALTLFQYCIDTTRKANSNGPNAKEITLVSRTVSPDEFGVLPVADPADLWPNGRVSAGGKPRPMVLRAEFANGAQVSFELKISYNRFSIVPSLQGDVQRAIWEREIRLVPIFSGFLPREEYLTPPARLDRMRLQRHGEMVRNLLWDLRENAKPRWSKLQELLAQLFPDSSVAVDFDIEVDRFLRATYRDSSLERERDVIAAGSGFHQALQIFASVLAPGAGTILLDEPDAHLHARLQGQLMSILSQLASEEGEQFVLATHSPQLLNAAPEGSLRVCMDGRVVPFNVQPEQLQLLEELGAMDRMELIPLLTNRAVVFVEDKRDRKLLEAFACKQWGEKKHQDIWHRLTFLYTYQSAVDAGVLDLARQVRDLLKSPGIASPRPVRMAAVSDRDYRTDEARRVVLRDHRRKARSEPYKLELALVIWEANEIENYLLDRKALLGTLDAQARAAGIASEWKLHRKAFEVEMDGLIEKQHESIRQAVATRIQQEDRRLMLKTALDRADEFLGAAWARPERWCDAKRVLSGLRAWLQAQKLPFVIYDRDLVDAMESVPGDVQRALRILRGLAHGPQRSKRKRSGGGTSK